jgi:hypothetical protein
MDADETAAALAEKKRVELIAWRTAELLRELDALAWRRGELDHRLGKTDIRSRVIFHMRGHTIRHAGQINSLTSSLRLRSENYGKLPTDKTTHGTPD